MKIEITEEDYINIKNCLEVTKNNWNIGIDLWPFTLKNIIEQYGKETQKKLEEDRIKILQYENLRFHFNKMIKAILGENYYNLGMDVYTCDELTCEDIIKKRTGLKFSRHLKNKGIL